MYLHISGTQRVVNLTCRCLCYKRVVNTHMYTLAWLCTWLHMFVVCTHMYTCTWLSEWLHIYIRDIYVHLMMHIYSWYVPVCGVYTYEKWSHLSVGYLDHLLSLWYVDFSDVLRGGGLGSSTIFKNLMSPTPRRKWYLTTGRRAH